MKAKRRHGIAEGFPNERLLIVPKTRLLAAGNLPVLRDLHVSHLGMFHEALHHLVIRPAGTDEYILIYCLAGKGKGMCGKKPFSLEAGGLVVLPPGTAHRYEADEEWPWSIFWFHFSGKRAADYVEALGIEAGKVTLHAPRVDELRNAFEETYRHALDGFSDSGLLGISTGFMRMVGLFRRFSRSKNLRLRRAEDKILDVVTVLQERLAEPWSLERMAELAGMSRMYFSARFRAQTGESPMRYVIHQRMLRAAALLQRGGGTVAEVAAKLGYEDPYYFSRIFKKILGISPKSYRKKTGHG